jgi:hypothetical protein
VVPVLAFVVAVPTVVLSVFLLGALAALNSVVALPVVTLGLFEVAGLPATVYGVPLLYGVAPSLLASIGMLVYTGGNWEGDHGDTRFPRFLGR